MSESYNKMPHYIQINLTCSKDKTLPLKCCYKMYDKYNERGYIDNLIIYEINLTKAKKAWYNKKEATSIIAMLDCDEFELNKTKGDVLVEKLKSEINRLNGDKDFVEYLSKEDEERLLTNTLKENSFNDGIEQSKLEIARNMLKENVDINLISKVTGLSSDKIEKLSE